MIYTGRIKRIKNYINTGYKKLADIKAETGCDLLFNGGIYDMRTGEIYCHLKADGKVIASDEYSYWGYGWNDNDVKLIADYAKVQNYIACVCLIRNGKPEPLIYNSGMGGARERTAWGIKPDGTHVFYVDKSPKTPEALQAFMLAQGCDSALMLDGGGSTQGIFPDGEVYSGRIVAHVICVWLDKPTEDKPDNSKPVEIDQFIIEPCYAWNGKLAPRTRTDYIILHHAAASGSAENIHSYHVSLGWTGIGYHYYIRKDGSIYRGRPENVEGAHTEGYNAISIGVCFEGNFETETMSEKQLSAGIWLIKDILTRYNVPIAPHRNFANTACPGRNFPLARMTPYAPTETPKTVTVELPLLSKGSKGGGVTTVQRLLIIMGYNPGTADGDFGPKTEAAVKEYQARNGLTADGVVGKLTWEKLLK